MIKSSKVFSVISASVILTVLGFVFVDAADCDLANLGAVAAHQKGDAVANVQLCLIDAGFGIPAGATGYYGGQTIAAVKAFYASWYGSWSGLKIGPLGITTLKKYSTGRAGVSAGPEKFETFIAAADFNNYFKKAIQESQSAGFGRENITRTAGTSMASDLAENESPAPAPSVNVSIDRASVTNVQVAGIDEPDIVKTDGKEIYYSGTNPVYWWRDGGGIMPSTAVSDTAIKSVMPAPEYRGPEAKIIKALPVSNMAVDSTIQKSGDLLLSGNILAVFGNGGVIGYNVSNPKNPAEIWNIKPEGNTSIIGSRLRDGKIYMVTKTVIGTTDTCPIKPLMIGGAGVTIPCGAIYHPERVLPADATFSVFVIDTATGLVENKTSFAGLGGYSVIYVSAENIFVTYPAYESEFTIQAGLIKENMKDMVGASLIEQIAKLEGYDISSDAKIVELNTILNNYKNGLSSDDRLKFTSEMQNRLTNYRKSQLRNFDKTIVAKIGLGDLKFYASGAVPGQPLNQFSLDEYNGNLRIATTIGSSWFMRSETANDVYVLDPEMKIIGSVLDLGKTEKIYSARFIEDKGYVVTFRQTDPFYVIDLADPRDPKLAGELKIPGYSGYLHPVNKDKIIGVGMENSNVKISYFNVIDPKNPAEMDKYSLDEHWSEAVSNHHAFLMDSRHEIFYARRQRRLHFSYANNKLSLKKAVSGINSKRAIYINDYLYVIGDNKISVLDENTWEKIKEFEF
jgi:Secreted protein containing C-terminal beta-propeller domain distantly related to WD-40 repeats